MPLGLDPNETVDVTLSVDEDKPEDRRLIFVARFMTCRQQRTYQDLIRKAYAEPEREKVEQLLAQAFSLALVDWRVPEALRSSEALRSVISSPFTIDAIDDALTYREKWDLAGEIPAKLRLSESEKKAYRSSAPSAAATSAQNADLRSATATGSGDAQTNPAPTSPTSSLTTPAPSAAASAASDATR